MACQCNDDKVCAQCVKETARNILIANKAMEKMIAWEGYEDDD